MRCRWRIHAKLSKILATTGPHKEGPRAQREKLRWEEDSEEADRTWSRRLFCQLILTRLSHVHKARKD